MTTSATIIVSPAWLRARARRDAPVVLQDLQSDERAKLNCVIGLFDQLTAAGLPDRLAINEAHKFGKTLEHEMRRALILSILRGEA